MPSPVATSLLLLFIVLVGVYIYHRITTLKNSFLNAQKAYMELYIEHEQGEIGHLEIEENYENDMLNFNDQIAELLRRIENQKLGWKETRLERDIARIERDNALANLEMVLSET